MNIIPIPFTFDAAKFPITGMISNYESLFETQIPTGIIHILQKRPRQVEMVSAFDAELNIIARDVLLPSHVREFRFSVENNVRTSIFDVLRMLYHQVTIRQHSFDAIMDLYELLYDQLDDYPGFDGLVSQLEEGSLEYGSEEYIGEVVRYFKQHIDPLVKDWYKNLEESSNHNNS